ncbi:MAG: hypothetical protein R3F55_22055 [Alphaproteobacteria bacterium]
MPSTRPYGAWASPITAEALTAGSIGLTPVGFHRGRACWLEARPAERGRVVLVAEGGDGAQPAELTPPDHSVRSRVHEYGGGAVATDGARLVYVNLADQRLHSLRPDGAAVPLTDPSGDRDPAVRLRRHGVRAGADAVACVREDHRAGGEPANAIVLVDLAGGAGFGRVVADGHDFFACPRFSPDGCWLAYLSWDHPNMPWDGTDLGARRSTPTAQSARQSTWPAARRNRSSSRNGRRTARCTSSPTAAAGGTSTAPARTGRCRCARSKPTAACRCGSSAPAASPSCPTARRCWR